MRFEAYSPSFFATVNPIRISYIYYNIGDGEIEVVKMIGPSKLLHKKTFAAGPSAGKAPEAANTDSKGDLLAELGAKYGCDFDRDTVVG